MKETDEKRQAKRNMNNSCLFLFLYCTCVCLKRVLEVISDQDRLDYAKSFSNFFFCYLSVEPLKEK